MEEKSKYEEFVKLAESSVQSISDPQLKVEAFKKILEDLLKKEETNSKSLIKSKDDSKILKLDKIKSNSLTQDNPEITQEELELVYRIEGSEIEIVCNFESNSKWQQVQYVFLSLFGNYLVTGNRSMLSQQIISKMKSRGFGELPNLNVFLRELEPKYIYVKTFKEKRKNYLELTINGIKASEKLVSAIADNSGKTFTDIDYILGIENKKRIINGNKIKSPLAKQISILIEEKFFNQPTPIKDLKKKLEEKGHFFAREVIDEKVRRVFLGKDLRRVKMGKKWCYVKNGNTQ